MKKQALLLIAHGSREPLANQEVEELAHRLAAQGGAGLVRAAFLDPVASPNIPEVIDELVAAGIQKIIALPYFLNSGKHVQHDIPELIAAKRRQYPELKITLTTHLGAHPGLLELIAEWSAQTKTPVHL